MQDRDTKRWWSGSKKVFFLCLVTCSSNKKLNFLPDLLFLLKKNLTEVRKKKGRKRKEKRRFILKSISVAATPNFSSFFRRDALKEQLRKDQASSNAWPWNDSWKCNSEFSFSSFFLGGACVWRSIPKRPKMLGRKGNKINEKGGGRATPKYPENLAKCRKSEENREKNRQELCLSDLDSS